MTTLFNYYPYAFVVLFIVLALIGLVFSQNLIKKIIALNIFQAAIIFFFIVFAHRFHASVPVIDSAIGDHPQNYVDPLPHGLMLTAIVVSVAMTGVALGLTIQIWRRYRTLHEDELLVACRDDGAGSA